MLYVPKKERIPEEKPILKHKSDFFILTLHFFGGGSNWFILLFTISSLLSQRQSPRHKHIDFTDSLNRLYD